MASSQSTTSPSTMAAEGQTQSHKHGLLHNKFRMAGVAVSLLLVIAAGYWLAPKIIGIGLISYSDTTGYSVKVPQGLIIAKNGDVTRVVERRDGVITSGVIINSQALPPLLDTKDAQKIEQQLTASAQNGLVGMLENKYAVSQVELTKNANENGNEIYSASVGLLRNGAAAGAAAVKIIVTDQRLYTVVVTGSRLLEQTDTIFDSFTVGD